MTGSSKSHVRRKIRSPRELLGQSRQSVHIRDATKEHYFQLAVPLLFLPDEAIAIVSEQRKESAGGGLVVSGAAHWTNSKHAVLALNS
jgi:hypothetical protein